MTIEKMFRDWCEQETARIALGAAHLMFVKGEPHESLLFVYGQHEQVAVLHMPLINEEAKDACARTHQTLAMHKLVRGVIHVSEVWHARSIPAEEDPSRKEALMMNCISKKLQLIALFDIDRERKRFGPPRFLDPKNGTTLYTGRMVLPPDKSQIN